MNNGLKKTCFDTAHNLLEKWNAGNHTRELGLNLMFHCWSLLEEPPMHTGFDSTRVEDRSEERRVGKEC